MTDKELLELAAKAAGYNFEWFGQHFHIAIDDRRFTSWNPLTDDGDALRLAAKLGLVVSVNYELGLVFCTSIDRQTYQASEGLKDPYEATRRAIVRAAAQIGKTL
jgi:hypothetical protein